MSNLIWAVYFFLLMEVQVHHSSRLPSQEYPSCLVGSWFSCIVLGVRFWPRPAFHYGLCLLTKPRWTWTMRLRSRILGVWCKDMRRVDGQIIAIAVVQLVVVMAWEQCVQWQHLTWSTCGANLAVLWLGNCPVSCIFLYSGSLVFYWFCVS